VINLEVSKTKEDSPYSGTCISLLLDFLEEILPARRKLKIYTKC
jgi:hypothetical protein